MAKKKWKINTTGLLKEAIRNNATANALRMPFQILANALFEVGERAIELNDTKLNCLMLRLGIYSISDPENEDFDQDAVNTYLDNYE